MCIATHRSVGESMSANTGGGQKKPRYDVNITEGQDREDMSCQCGFQGLLLPGSSVAWQSPE